MYTLELYKLSQIIFIILLVSIAARIHQVSLPKSYSSILDFRYSKDVARTIKSSSIRLGYLSVISMAASIIGIHNEEILIGVGTAAFLNVWPPIMQYRLLFIFENKAEKNRLLFGYICFICFSILFSYISIEYILKSLQGESVFGVTDSKGFEILISLLFSGLAINAETILSRFAKFEYSLDIETYRTDLEILLVQVEIEEGEMDIYHYEIEQGAKEYQITEELLRTILVLEKIHRGAWYYKYLELLFCKVKVLQRIAIHRDISVGLGQIKISTAQALLKKNPYSFIDKMPEASFGVKLCANYLGDLVDAFVDMYSNDIKGKSVYEYIASEYLSGKEFMDAEIVKLYSAVLEKKDGNNVYDYVNKRLEPYIENHWNDYLAQCEKVALYDQIYYIREPINLTVRFKGDQYDLYLQTSVKLMSVYFVHKEHNMLSIGIPISGENISGVMNLKNMVL